ncbi:MAG: hypothetical protein ACRDK9_15205, partial [Solirubrobacterales bacterium]
MSRSAASTPAGRRIASRRASGRRTQTNGRRAAAKPRQAPARKAATRRPAPKRKAAPKRTAARKRPPTEARRSSTRPSARTIPRSLLSLPLTIGGAIARAVLAGVAAASWRGRIALVAVLAAVLAGGYFG